jgi:DHA2 family multidrug resistance protein
VHAQIAERVTPFNHALQTGSAYLFWNSATHAGLSNLNAEITRQATIIAYMDDFKLMLLVALPPVFLLLLMRKPRTAPAMGDHVAVVD